MNEDNKPIEGREYKSLADENQRLKSQVAAFGQLLDVYEKTVLGNSETLYTEIARRKELEEALQTSRLQLSEAMDLSRIVHWDFDPSTRMLKANDAFYKFNGTNIEKEGSYLIPMEEYARRFIHPDDLHIFYQHKKRMDSSPDLDIPPDLEHRIIRGDGEVRYIINRTRVVKDAEGHVIHVYGANQDITEHKRMEDELLRSKTALEIKSLQLSEAMKLARIVNWEMDYKKKIFIFNDAFYALLGTSAEEEGGYLMSPEKFAKRFIYPEDLPLFFQHNKKVDEIREQEFVADLKHRIVRVNGEVRHVFARSRIFKNTEGKVVRIFGAIQDITERKQMEEEISRSVSLLNATLDSTADGILVVDLTGKIVNFNNRFLEMWHIPDDVMKTKDDNQALSFVFSQLSSPDEFMSKVKELYAQPDAESFDELHFKDGRVFERYSRPQRLEDRIVGRVWSFRDVTERKATEWALRDSEEKFRAMVETTSDFVWEADLNGIYTYASPRIKNILGYEPAEIVGKKVIDFMSPEDSEQVAGAILELSKSAMPAIGMETIHIHKDGRRVIFETNAVPIFDAKGQLAGYRGIDRDITRRKKAEEALKETAYFLQTLMDAIPNPVFYKDINGVYLGCNAAFEAYLGRTKDEIVGKSTRDLSPRELADKYIEMDDALFQQGGVQVYESVVQNKDGARHNVIFNKAIYTNAVGNTQGLIGVILDITKRKQAEEALEKAYAIQKSVIESPREVVIFALDREYRYITFNQNHNRTMKQIWGADIALGVSMLEYIKSPEDREKAKINFNRALSGESFVVVEEYGDSSLARRYYEDAYNPITDEKGEIIGLTLFLVDITDRRQAEERLRISEVYHKSIIENISDVVSIIAPDGTIQYESPSIEHVMGYKPSEIVGQSVFDLIYPDDLTYMKENFHEDLRKHGPKIPDVVRRKHKDGSWRVMEVTGRNMMDDEIIKGMLIISRDITERKKTEELLRQSEERYRMIAESAHDTIWTTDLNGRMTYISPSVKRLTGYTPEEVMQSGIDLMTQESIVIAREDMRRMIGQFMAGAVPESRHLELEFIRKDGPTVWAEMTSNPMFDASGQFVGIQGVSRDITDRKKAREDLQKLNDELERKVEERTNQLVEAQEELVRKEKLAIMGQLAGIVGHEIRNPLGVINNAAYFLRTILTDADDIVKEYLDMIKQEISNSQRIITDLLDFARTRPPHAQTIATKTLIDQSIRKCLIPENIAVNIDVPETLPLIWVDPAQTEQVFQNMITNAVQAMPEGGVLRVSAGVGGQRSEAGDQGTEKRSEAGDQRSDKTEPQPPAPDSNFVEIVIADTGPGIPPENMKKLFQPLFTTKAKGIGLGLVVCKNLVEANGGKIDARSEPGKGATFSVSLPVEQWIDD